MQEDFELSSLLQRKSYVEPLQSLCNYFTEGSIPDLIKASEGFIINTDEDDPLMGLDRYRNFRVSTSIGGPMVYCGVDSKSTVNDFTMAVKTETADTPFQLLGFKESFLKNMGDKNKNHNLTIKGFDLYNIRGSLSEVIFSDPEYITNLKQVVLENGYTVNLTTKENGDFKFTFSEEYIIPNNFSTTSRVNALTLSYRIYYSQDKAEPWGVLYTGRFYEKIKKELDVPTNELPVNLLQAVYNKNNLFLSNIKTYSSNSDFTYSVFGREYNPLVTFFIPLEYGLALRDKILTTDELSELIKGKTLPQLTALLSRGLGLPEEERLQRSSISSDGFVFNYPGFTLEVVLTTGLKIKPGIHITIQS